MRGLPMSNTHEVFRQITDLLAAGHSQTAWQLFVQTLSETYDEGAADTEYDHNQAQEV